MLENLSTKPSHILYNMLQNNNNNNNLALDGIMTFSTAIFGDVIGKYDCWEKLTYLTLFIVSQLVGIAIIYMHGMNLQ